MKQELRLVLSLFYFERLSYGEIAVILELPRPPCSHIYRRRRRCCDVSSNRNAPAINRALDRPFPKP
jgi:DNA-directed RNA polymerase specialized sigma24 family protein